MQATCVAILLNDFAFAPSVLFVCVDRKASFAGHLQCNDAVCAHAIAARNRCFERCSNRSLAFVAHRLHASVVASTISTHPNHMYTRSNSCTARQTATIHWLCCFQASLRQPQLHCNTSFKGACVHAASTSHDVS